MKSYFLSALIILLMLIFLPVAVIESPATDSEQILARRTASDSEYKESVRVLQVSSGNILEVGLEEYLIGAVAAEFTPSCHEEALKAQTVACYTYLKWILQNTDNAPNVFSDITDDGSIHQSFLTEDKQRELWGDRYEDYYSKISKAAEQVQGEYICLENEPACAVYHSLSSGYTCSSEDVWGEAIPCLTGVEAPGDKLSDRLITTNTFTLNEFKAMLQSEKNISFTEKDTVKILSTGDGGYVKSIDIAGNILTGNDIKSLFSLSSACFTAEQKEDKIIFTVYGSGNGLGMSLNSADFMARQGSDYKQILTHFYQETEIIRD